MLALALRPGEVIWIDAPEGDVRIAPCPPPKFFRVHLWPGQSLHAEPATDEELSEHGGARSWIVVSSAAGQVRIRRFGRRSRWSPRPAGGEGEAGPRPQERPTPPENRAVRGCRIGIEAPHYMAVWREKVKPDEGADAGLAREGEEGIDRSS